MDPSPPHLVGDEVALGRYWHPLALAADVGSDPRGVTLLGQRLVLARLDDRLLLAADRCPHRHAPLRRGRVADGCLTCAYHGWRFDGSGTCVEVPSLGPGAARPARADLAPLPVAEAAGLVWGALHQPEGPPPAFPEADGAPPDPDGGRVDVISLVPRETPVTSGRLVENFLDVTHFPFLHADTFGTDAALADGHGEMSEAGPGFRHVLRQPFLNREDPGVATGERPVLQTRVLAYTWIPPFTARLRIDWVEAGVTKAILFAARPTGARGSVAFQVVARSDLGGDPAATAAARAFEDTVFDEDLALLESYDEPGLPLDLRREVHVRSDRPTVELRRRLAALVAEGDGALPLPVATPVAT